MNMKTKCFKRLLSLVMAVAMLLTFLPAGVISASTGTVVYLKPNSNWLVDGARFAAYCWNGNGNIWLDMTDTDGDGYYEGTVPSGYPNIIFCRMNPSQKTNNWNNKWNQTSDLTLPTDGKNCFTVSNGVWDGGGTWSTYTPAVSGETEPVEYVTIHFRNTGAWGTVYGYAWDLADDTTYHGGWPGQVLTQTEGHANWYTLKLAGLNAAKGVGFVFNNNSDQTEDIKITASGEYWYDSKLLTEAPDTWADGTVSTEQYRVTLHFANRANWGSVYLYTWTSVGMHTGAWPGTKTVQDANGFYTLSFEYEALAGQDLNYIFSGGGQTVDLKLSASEFTKKNGVYTAEKWVIPTTTDSEGKYYAVTENTAEAVAISPVVNGNSVTIQYKGSTSDTVQVFGSMNNWASGYSMTCNAYGVWSVTLDNLSAGIHQYKLVVNGNWMADPLNSWTVGNDGNSAFLISDPNKDTNTITLKIHYNATSPEWNVCAWGAPDLAPQYNFSNGVATITLDGRASQYVAFKVRKSIPGNPWAQQSGEVRVDLSSIVSGTIDVYVGSDFSVSQSLNEDVVLTNKISSVELDYDKNTVTIVTVNPVNDPKTAFDIFKDGVDAGIIESISVIGSTYTLTLSDTLDLVNLYRYTVRFNEQEKFTDYDYAIGIHTVYASEMFDAEFTYTGNDLGATWYEDYTVFRVWAPTAASVQVMLYATGSDTEEGAAFLGEYAMMKDVNGTWVVIIEGDLNRVYYTYLVNVNGKDVEAVDPYARTTGVNGERGMVIDLYSTNPDNWRDDQNPNPLTSYTDAILYELHIRDFSIDDSSGVKDAWRGKYLAFTQHGTTTPGGMKTGIDYLEELGITHLHLLPFYDYGSVDETKCENFNWGYDPVNYNAPEGSYSTDPYHGEVRVEEFKLMVQALHEADISVVMDVVYNHVYDAGMFSMNLIVPGYFSRFNADGSYSNGSGCGNDTASEREMVRKYIVDSVLYWHQEYHIDGFRFDLVGLLDQTTINEIVDTVHACCPDVIFYGEGWTMGTAVEPGNTMTTQANSTGTPDFAFFSDTIRNLLAGSNGSSLGFASGLTGQEEAIRDNFMAKPWWSSNPTQIVQYASCHDNYTLVDKIILSTGKSGIDADVIKMNNLAAAIYMTSQGIPFIHAGEELLREKLKEDGGRCENSYNASDYVNHIEWSNLDKDTYADNSAYYQGLIAFRKAHPALRLTTREDIDQYVTYTWITNEVVMFTIDGSELEGETAEQILVIFNANKSAKNVTLPEGDWDICIDSQKAGIETLRSANGSVSVAGISAMVMVSKKHVHDWNDGVCDGCGEICEHDWDDTTGTCLICGSVCAHEVHWQNGLCSTCYATVEHVYDPDNGMCSCGKSLCDHTSHNVSGMCTDCGLAVGHTIGEDGICPICTYNQNLTANLAGTMNGWDAGATIMYSVGGTNVAVKMHLTPGTYQFKIVYNGQWYGNDGTIERFPISGWEMNGGNCTLKVSQTGNYTFVYDTAQNKLSVYSEKPETLYLRGSFNNWGTDIVMTDHGDGTYRATLTLAAGNYEHKVGYGDWFFSYPTENAVLTLEKPTKVTFVLKYNEAGACTLTYIFEDVQAGLVGDINGDGEVDVMDANMTVAYYYGNVELTDSQIALADVNGDGEVDVMDANMIIAYFYGNIEKFPAEG